MKAGLLCCNRMQLKILIQVSAKPVTKVVAEGANASLSKMVHAGCSCRGLAHGELRLGVTGWLLKSTIAEQKATKASLIRVIKV